MFLQSIYQGHGQDQSPIDVTWDFPYITTQLDELLDIYKSYDITLLGYSMGGSGLVLCGVR